MIEQIQAFADPTRLEILRLLSRSEMPAGKIAEHFPQMTRPAVSQHLRVLREAGLVYERKEGTKRLYRLRRKGISDLYGLFEELWGKAA